MPRPDRYSEAVNKLIVDALYPDVVKWLKDEHERAEEEEEGIKNDLLRAIDDAIHDESYELMKSLDDHSHWAVDSTLQDILDRVGALRYKFHDEEVAKYVTENEIVLTLSQGMKVTFERHGTMYKGEIIALDSKRGMYHVYCSSLGHVKTGTGTLATILPCEEVALYCEPPQP